MATAELVLPTQDPAVLDYQQRAVAIRREAEALVVDSPEAKATAVDFLARVARLRRDAEATRTGLVKPFNDHVAGVNRVFKDVLGPVEQADRVVRDKTVAWDRTERQRAAEAAARAERARLESEAMLQEAERAEAAGKARVAEQLLETAVARENTAKAVATQAVAPPRTVASGAGSATTRMVWTFAIDKEADIPREYLELNEARVRKAIIAGEREIPGLRIFQTESLSVRA